MKKNKNKKILIIVNGGIAAYKSLELIRNLKKKYNIECILTKNVSKFIKPITFSSLIGKSVHNDLFLMEENNKMSHIHLAQNNDLTIVIPATANFIGKMANGIADDLATTTILATKSKIFVAPAMNTGMWENKAVIENTNILKKRGITILSPEKGELACGQVGQGKLMNVTKIFNSIENFFKKTNLLQGLNAVVTSGPSVERIDPVRFLSNFSSGTQGYEIAKALSEAGAKTTLISGPTKLRKPDNVILKNVLTGEEFLQSSLKTLPADIFVSVAAISDWRLKNFSVNKIKKSKKKLNLNFEENPDTLQIISSCNQRPRLVIGFSAETKNLIENSKKKLLKKKCDWMVANDVSDGKVFNSNRNKVFILKKRQVVELPKTTKKNIAERLVREIYKDFKKSKIIL